MGIAAALTPRVRMMVICDRIRASKTEAGVFDLKGVRQVLTINSIPSLPVRLRLFLLLSSPRPGVFPGHVRVANDLTDRTVFYGHLSPKPTFGIDDFMVPVQVSIRCSFPEPGNYSIQVWFFQAHASDVLKGELPFLVRVESD